MAVDFTGRHVEITPAIREFTLEKLRKLDKVLDDINEVHVILTVEKHRHIAEIVVHSRTTTLSGSGETEDMYSAIGLVMDKLDRQAKKHKDKVKRHSKKKRTESIRTGPGVRPPKRRPVAASVPEGPRIIRSNRYQVKPMTPEEALLEADEIRDSFLVFRNSISQRISVLYRRPDGNFGLIEP